MPRHDRRSVEVRYSLHGTILAARPICCCVDGRAFLANSWALPLSNASCCSIECLNVLEFVRDDEAMIDELARVLRPRGTLRLRVPNAGPLAGLDAYNLYRYLVDTIHRGSKPIETDEIGWRRHYDLHDLAALFGPRFAIQSITTQRIGAGELLNAMSLGLFRWLLGSESGYQRAREYVRRVEQVEDRITSCGFGTVLTVDAVRQSAPGTVTC
jgi:SAM-dependent methyltransferase